MSWVLIIRERGPEGPRLVKVSAATRGVIGEVAGGVAGVAVFRLVPVAQPICRPRGGEPQAVMLGAATWSREDGQRQAHSAGPVRSDKPDFTRPPTEKPKRSKAKAPLG